MRADRLVAALLVLQSRGRVTAGELADELEVSVKTARRDLEALSMSGIPVYPQPGRNGGWQLVGGSRTDLTGLTAAEARTLFLVAGPASTATPEAKAALRKLVQALPETMREDAEAAARSTVIDAASWGSVPVAAPRFLGELRHAVVARRQVRLGYVDRTRSESSRVVHPLGVVEKGSTWYLVANTDNGLRTFRVTRVRAVEQLADPVVRPPDFDLAEAWRAIADEVEQKRAQAKAVVRIERGGVSGLRTEFGPLTRVITPGAADEVVPDEDEERQRWWRQVVDVEVVGVSEWVLAQRLASWAAWAEIVGPPEVRGRLAGIGRDLVERYA